MKLNDLTREEKKEIKKEGRRCDCHLTAPATCERCLNRTVKVLIRREKGDR